MTFFGDKNKKEAEKNGTPEDRERFYSWKKAQEIMHPQEIESGLSFFSRIKSFCVVSQIVIKDHWHLLIRSAAENHLRIQKCKTDFEKDKLCSLNFKSYSHLKNYQKKFRLITYSSSSTALSVLIAMLVIQVFLPSLKSHGATFTFSQTSWLGGTTGNSANHTSNQTLWNEYQSKDPNIAVTGGGADLQLALPAVQSLTDDNDGDFVGAQSGDGFYADGTGKLYLKKPQTATCTLAAQCASGVCTGNVCQ